MLTVTPYRPHPVLDRAAIREAEAAQRAAQVSPAHCTREQIAARVAACRACQYAAHGSATCAACELRCAHPAATTGAQLLAVAASICPRNLWPDPST